MVIDPVTPFPAVGQGQYTDTDTNTDRRVVPVSWDCTLASTQSLVWFGSGSDDDSAEFDLWGLLKGFWWFWLRD